MLGQRRRRWPNLETTPDHGVVFAGRVELFWMPFLKHAAIFHLFVSR